MFQGIAAFGTMGFVIFFVLGLYQNKAVNPIDRINKALGQTTTQSIIKDHLPLKNRLMKSFINYVSSVLGRWLPTISQGHISSKLNAAGLEQWKSAEWEALKISLAILFSLILILLTTISQASLFSRMAISTMGFIIGYIFPDSWLKSKIRQRKEAIQQSLPDTLDLLTVSVEAGLGFDSALLKVVEKQEGPLAQEFLHVLQEIKMGRPRRDALRDLGKRNENEDLKNVVASLVQADQLGIAIGGVLRNQADQIRVKRRQRAEEKAQKAPVKIMLPLVFFIFPFIFIIVLGPAIIQIYEMFAGK